MTQAIDPLATEISPATDLVAAALRVFAASPGPLTISKIRSKLPTPFRSASLEELADTLQRQVAANVLFQYPKYRSQQDRYWDRPMEAHLAALFREALQEGPLGWVELRRKLPAYAVDPLTRAEAVLTELLTQGALHRHPRSGKRGGDRFGLQAPDAKEYLQTALSTVFLDLEQLGFTQAQLRAAALELLHDEEWSPTAPQSPEREAGGSAPETQTGPPAETHSAPHPAQEPTHAQSSPPTHTDSNRPAAAGHTTPAHETGQPHAQASPTAST